MILKLNCKHHKGNFSHNDILINKNTEVTLVNMAFVKEVTNFDVNEMKGYAFNYFGFLEGSKSTLSYDYYNRIHCIESVEDIYEMLNGTK